MNVRDLMVLAALLLGIPAQAHIGSPAVVFDGMAGPYPVRVIVQPPPVVPGRAEINVRLLRDADQVARVTVLPVNARAGLKGAPAPDEAAPVRGDMTLRHAELWLMTSGSYSVHVAVSGAKGAGTAIVPVLSVATRRLPMSRGLGVLLGALGVLLFAGGVTLVTVAARDATSAEDRIRTPAQTARGYIAMAVAVVVFGALLWTGKRWWDREDLSFRVNQLYRPLPLAAIIDDATRSPVIHLDIGADGRGGEDLLLIPDHGKLMHLFLIREPQLDALAHLHPIKAGARSFIVPAPPLPAGTYRLYADVTYETGFAATLTTTLNLPDLTGANDSAASRDPDDSWFVGTPGAPGSTDVILTRTGPAEIHAGEDLTLAFAARTTSGAPVELEPYMGMQGHAAIRSDDGSVFAHIHPVGTFSMAAEMYFQRAAARQSGLAMDHSHHHMTGSAGSTVSFPFLFPKAGPYRVWIQSKARGKVITGAFDFTVLP